MHDGRGAGHLAKVWVFEGARAPFGEGGPRRAPPVGRAGGWELEKRMRIEFELRMVCLRRRRCQKAIQKAVRRNGRKYFHIFRKSDKNPDIHLFGSEGNQKNGVKRLRRRKN